MNDSAISHPGNPPLRKIRRCVFYEETGDQEHGESDRDAREQFFRRGHDRMKPCSRSPKHSRPKIWRNSEDSVAAFGHDEGRSPAGVRFFAGGQVIVSYGSRPCGNVFRLPTSAPQPGALGLDATF